jgi:hypothetical protein
MALAGLLIRGHREKQGKDGSTGDSFDFSLPDQPDEVHLK